MRFRLLVGSAVFVLSCSPRGGTRTGCNAPDGVSTHYLAVIRLTLGNTYRRMAFRLPPIGAADVHLVSDPAVCARAGQVMVQLKPKHPSLTSLYVYQIGTSYAVIDRDTGGDYDGIYFFDPTWHLSGSEFAQ
jgi:hypothetical protein